MNDLSNKVCISNKTEDLNLGVFYMIKRLDEPTTLTKHVSCECKCKFNEAKYKSNQLWNNDIC